MTQEETGLILVELIQSNFINEERFAFAYVKGKFNQKNWGPKKIEIGLIQAGVSRYLIDKALSNIPKSNQENTIEKLALKKIKSWGYSTEESLKNISKILSFTDRQKLIKFLYQKGYNFEDINKVIGG